MGGRTILSGDLRTPWKLCLFPAGTTVRDPHLRESTIHREQDLYLR